MWSKSKPNVEFQYGGRLGEFSGMSSQPLVTMLQGAATWWIHCHDSRAPCHIAGCSLLAKSMSWLCHIAGCKNSICHIENRFSSNLLFLFLMQFRLWWAAAFVSSPRHLFIKVLLATPRAPLRIGSVHLFRLFVRSPVTKVRTHKRDFLKK